MTTPIITPESPQTVNVKLNEGAILQNAGTVTNHFPDSPTILSAHEDAHHQTAITTASTTQKLGVTDWRNVLPAPDSKKVEEIQKDGTFDLNHTFGVSLVALENQAALEASLQNAKTESAKKQDADASKAVPAAPSPNTTPKAAETKPVQPQTSTAALDDNISYASLNNEAKKAISIITHSKNSPNPVEDYSVDPTKLKQQSANRFHGKSGYDLNSLPENDVKYIQTALGVSSDGIAGKQTLEAARKVGILQANGTIDEKKLIAFDAKYLEEKIIKPASLVAASTAPSSAKAELNERNLSDLVGQATLKGLSGVSATAANIPAVPANEGQKPQSPQSSVAR